MCGRGCKCVAAAHREGWVEGGVLGEVKSEVNNSNSKKGGWQKRRRERREEGQTKEADVSWSVFAVNITTALLLAY